MLDCILYDVVYFFYVKEKETLLNNKKNKEVKRRENKISGKVSE
jgi:hypothetical protein